MPILLAMSSGSENAIEVRDLIKSYDGRTNAVDGVNFHVARGEIYGLLGKNGAGKSTTIKILTTLIPQTSGEAYVMDLDTRHKPKQVREIIGVVQQGEAFDFTTVEGNFRIYQMLWQMPREEASSRTEMLLEMFNLQKLRKRRLFELSGGEKKRVQVARELMHDMDVLFLDEPTVGMDPIMRRQVLDFIRKKVKEGLTVLFTTQILEEADYICDRIGIINNGRIQAEGSASALKSNYGEMRKIEVVLTNIPGQNSLSAVNEFLSSLEQIHSFTVERRNITVLTKSMGRILSLIIQKLTTLGLEVETVATDNPSLDDVFLEVVGK